MKKLIFILFLLLIITSLAQNKKYNNLDIQLDLNDLKIKQDTLQVHLNHLVRDYAYEENEIRGVINELYDISEKFNILSAFMHEWNVKEQDLIDSKDIIHQRFLMQQRSLINIYDNYGKTNDVNKLEDLFDKMEKLGLIKQNPVKNKESSKIDEEHKEKNYNTDSELSNKAYNAMDFTNSIVRDFAVNLAKKAKGPYNITQICYIWDYLKNHWSYVNDPSGFEYFAKASESVSLLAGDCDDFAILLASMLKAIGGTPRVILAYDINSGHAYTEVLATDNYNDLLKLFNSIQDFYFWKKLFSGKKLNLYYEKDKNGYWINLDWNSSYVGDSPFFNFNKRIIISDDGSYITEQK